MTPRLRLRLLVAALPVFLALHRAPAADQLQTKELNRVKDATVFVSARFPTAQGSGSGFLIKKDQGLGYIVTNAHVVREKENYGYHYSDRVTVTFWSGTENARFYPARVVTLIDEHDLALLAVEGDNLPEPVVLPKTQAARETTPIFIFGFPFGVGLSTGAPQPQVSVSPGVVTAIQTNDAKVPTQIDLKGDIHPGNSGGPVVDRSGLLVGVTTAKLVRTQVGMAGAAAQVARMLDGHLADIDVSVEGQVPGSVDLVWKVRKFDRNSSIKSLAVFGFATEVLNAETNQLPETNAHIRPTDLVPSFRDTLAFDKDLASGKIRLKGNPALKATYHLTIRWEDASVLGESKDREAWMMLPIRFAQPRIFNSAAAKTGGDDWLGQEKNELKQVALATPWPTLTQIPLAPGLVEGKDFRLKNIFLNPKEVAGDPIFSPDGSWCYLLEKSGRLRKIHLPDWVETASLGLTRKCNFLSLSGEGLIVQTANKEAIVVDPRTLREKSRFTMHSDQKMATAPVSSWGFAAGPGNGEELCCYNLMLGRLDRTLSAKHFGPPEHLHPDSVPGIRDFISPEMTSDGKYLIFISLTAPHRFRIQGGDLRYEESGRPWYDKRYPYSSLTMSADGQYFLIEKAATTVNTDGTFPDYLKPLFEVENLDPPVVSVRVSHGNHNLVFDPGAERVYSLSYRKIHVFRPDGTAESTVELPLENADNLQGGVIHPDGKKMIIRTDRKLYWLELKEPRP